MIRRYAEIVVRFRVLVLVCALASVVSSYWALSRFQTDGAIASLLEPGDPTLEALDRFQRHFGSDETMLVMIQAPDVFAPAVLDAVARYTTAMQESRDVPFSEVVSLTSVREVRSGEDGVDIRLAIEAPPRNAGEQAALRERVLGGSIADSGLVSADGATTAIVGRVRQTGVEPTREQRAATLAAMRRLVEEYRPADPGVSVTLIGAGEVDQAISEGLARDNQRSLPITGAVLATLMALCLGGLRQSLLAVVSAVGALVLVAGSMALADVRLNLVTVMIPAVVVTIGMGDAIYVVSRFREHARELGAGVEAVTRTLSEICAPAVVSALTTAVGFGSLLLSDQKPVREFGGFVAIGVLAAFLLNFAVLPGLLLFLPRPRRARSGASTRVVAAIEAIVGWAVSHASLVRGVGWCALAFGLAGTLNLRTGMNTLDFFRKPIPELMAISTAERALGGSKSLEVMLEGQPGSVVSPAALAWIADLSAVARSEPVVTGVESVVDLLDGVQRALGTTPADAATPRSADRLLALYELGAGPADLQRWLDYDTNSVTRISLRRRVADSSEIAALVTRIDGFVAAHPPPDGLVATVTGRSVLMSRLTEAAFETLLWSSMTAGLMILATLAVLFRSLRVAAICMVPNLIPIAIGVGMLGVLGIPLDATTATAASIGIGLAVNDTIYLTHGFLKGWRAGVAAEEALAEHARTLGEPTLYTSVMLAAGFAALMLGEFLPIVHLGLVLATMVSAALLCDLLVTPALLVLYARAHERAAEPVAAALEVAS